MIDKEPWKPRWQRVDGTKRGGGQATGWLAVDTKYPGKRPAFLKIPRSNSPQARGRFRREVVAYETLMTSGVPVLYDHNAGDWEDCEQRLFLAVEFIDGTQLDTWVQSRGPATFKQALACARTVQRVLSAGHQLGVVHRDIKPANIILRDDNPAGAVLVDYGLSFTESEDDLTRVDEEVGNRFLRLPEHSTGGRDPVSDVTQLAGVVLYMLTGEQPRVLRDGSGRAPHQRERPRLALQGALEERPLRRLLAVFDRAFAPLITSRYLTAQDLVDALDTVMMDPVTGDHLADLQAKARERLSAQSEREAIEHRRRLAEVLSAIAMAHRACAQEFDLRSQQTGYAIIPVEYLGTPRGAIALALLPPSHFIAENVDYLAINARIEGAEVVVRVDREDIWRGNVADKELSHAVKKAALARFSETL